MGRAINLVQKLWTAGVSTDIVYDVSQSQETMLEHCRQAGITCMALVSDKDGNYIKVKSFEKERQSEKRIPESDLVDHIVQKCRTKFFEERNIRETSETVSLQNTKGSLVNASGSSEQHGSSASSNINVLLISPEKVSSSARRRYETQFDEQFNISVKHLLSRLPKQRHLRSICEEIHCFKILKIRLLWWFCTATRTITTRFFCETKDVTAQDKLQAAPSCSKLLQAAPSTTGFLWRFSI